MSDSPSTGPGGQPGYPLLLGMAGRRAVVVGGGTVGLRRVRGLLDAAADVLVVAPEVVAEIAEWADHGRLVWEGRNYRTGDLDGAWLAQTATGVAAVDALVARDADDAHVWCVRADDASASAAWTPAVSRRDDLVVAVSGGRDPRRPGPG